MPVANGPRIGVAWSGNPSHTRDRDRSMPLRTLLPLLKHARPLFALQPYMTMPTERFWTRRRISSTLGKAFRDFADTAAVIAALDLVISVDTSVAHLAATMGKPTWILLPFRPDWRWQLDRDDSPWYPSVRLFRQTEPGDWDNVIERVRQALRDR